MTGYQTGLKRLQFYKKVGIAWVLWAGLRLVVSGLIISV